MSGLPSRAGAIVLGITLLATAGVQADPIPATIRSPDSLSDMHAGRLLIRAGRLEHARAFLEQAQPSNEDEQIERLFLLGRIERYLDMPERAAERFESILAIRPALTRARLELARAYFLAGRDDKARYHFSLALADALPPSVQAGVEEFLRRIDARKRWSLSVSASVLPETMRPDRETILIGGVPFRLDEETRASSGIGGFLSAGVSYSPKLTDDLRGVLGASAAAKQYRGSRWDDVTSSGDVGFARLFDRGSVSGGVRLGRRWIGGEGDQRSVGPWGRTRWRFSDSTRLDVALSAVYRRHDTRADRDGWRITLSPRLVHALDGRTLIEAEPRFEYVEAKQDHHASRLAGVGLMASRAFDGGLSASLDADARIRRHVAPDPLFGKRRVDRNLRLGIRLLHRSLRYRGFTPYVGYSFERNRSNIPIHEYRVHGFLAGVSRAF